jgi:hypothetical protein
MTAKRAGRDLLEQAGGLAKKYPSSTTPYRTLELNADSD